MFDDIKQEVHDGIYSDWRIEDADIAEVLGYRAGISVAALCTVAAYSSAVLHAPALSGTALDFACATGATGFAASLYLIHIYVKEIKATIQALFVLGLVGAVVLSQLHTGGDAASTSSVLGTVIEQRWAVLPVGPMFAAVTAVAIKEGLCYGKLEAALLAAVTPAWLLSHLTGWLPEGAEVALASAYTLVFAVFAARKYTQPIKDDIGDKSVFDFQKLPAEEQERLIRSRSPSMLGDEVIDVAAEPVQSRSISNDR